MFVPMYLQSILNYKESLSHLSSYTLIHCLAGQAIVGSVYNSMLHNMTPPNKGVAVLGRTRDGILRTKNIRIESETHNQPFPQCQRQI